MDFNVEVQNAYGKDVMAHVETDELRRSQCMCLHCDKFNPGTDHHCEIASRGYQLAVSTGIAFMVTRCPFWSVKA